MGIFIGLAAALLAILFNLYAGPAFHQAFGPIGAAFTEIGFALIALAAAVCYVVWKRQDLDHRHMEYGESDYTVESVFPFKAPKAGHVIGGLFLMFAGVQISTMYYNIVMRLFPETYAALNDAILASTYSGTFASVFCSIAVLPAFCEEFLLRGAIQKAFGDLKKPLYTILLTGFLFGLFHIDPIRIPFATMMGILLSYAYYRSKTIVVPILMHFANNAYSVITSWQYRDMTSAELMAETSAAMADPLTSVITGLVSVLALMLISTSSLFAGISSFEPNLLESLKQHRKCYIAAVACIVVLGIGMFVSILLFGF